MLRTGIFLLFSFFLAASACAQPSGYFPVPATNTTQGIMRGDGTTLSCSAGVCSTIGGGGTITGITAGTGLTGGGTTGNVTVSLSTPVTAANGGTGIMSLCTGVATALGNATGAAGGLLTFSGAMGTPSSITLTNATGLPVAGLTGLGTGVATALGNAVNGSGGIATSAVTTLSSLTSIGTIGTGTWQGSVIGSTYGGTGVNNGANTLTMAGSHTLSGAFASTFTFTGATNVTFPTSGTLVNSGVTTLSSLTSIGTLGTLTTSGYSYLGTSSAVTGGNGNVTINVGTGSAINEGRFSNDANSADTYANKSRGTSWNAQAAVQSGDGVMGLLALASDGTSFQSVGNIHINVDAAPSTGIVPGNITFQTANASGVLKEAMRINSSQQVAIGTTTATGILTIDQEQNAYTYEALANGVAGSSASAGLRLSTYGNYWDVATGSTANNGNNLVFSAGSSTKATLTTGGVLTTSGSITTPGTLTAFNLSVSGGSASLTNGTSNTLFYGSNGSAAPGASSAGEKIQLSGTSGTVAQSDYAIGIGASNMWFNTAAAGYYNFYVNGSSVATISSAGLITGTGLTLGSNTLTLGGSLTTSGAFATTLTATAATNVTLPTSGTLATTANINTALPSVATTTPLTGTGAAGGVQAATATLVLPNGTTATSQAASDTSSAKVATQASLAAMLASPPAIGNTAAAAGSFTTLTGVSAAGTAITGTSTTGYGAQFTSGAFAVTGISTASSGAYTGVVGSSASSTGNGVSGSNSVGGNGVSGSSASGNGGYFTSTSGNALVSNGAFVVQNSGTPSATITAAGSAGFGTASPSDVLQVGGGKIYTSGTTPTIAANACGSTTQGTITGTDMDGAVTVGTVGVTTCTISLSKTYTQKFRQCQITPANATAAATGTTLAYVAQANITTSAWAISGSALASAVYNYHCE